jgi:hypothetical protein
MGGTRPRMKITDKMLGAEAVKDDRAFTQSLGSKNAKEIKTNPQNINLELWFDKHYCDRDQHGGDDGIKRDICPNTVEALVIKSFKHLLFYSSVVKGFYFFKSSRPS